MNGPLERAALDRLLDIAGGDRAFVVEIIDEYLADSATLLAALREASGDELRRTAHSLKSTSASVGAERLAALCARIEAGGGDAALTADAEREYAAVRAALERERAVFS